MFSKRLNGKFVVRWRLGRLPTDTNPGRSGSGIVTAVDWRHISVCIRHVDTTCQTILRNLYAFETHEIDTLIRNLRWRVSHGRPGQALGELATLIELGMQLREKSIGARRDVAISVVTRPTELSIQINCNIFAVVNHKQRPLQGRAVSTSRAEGLVDGIAKPAPAKSSGWDGSGAERIAWPQ
ncbi:hypothetical protein KX928_03195 [Roseobacter sp. YSTF-M11]|uniref:Uncharacterized protein n=1 Tax=Roseobacter insulae TaxID=2859783 RepID=A0A9X1FSR1_9RHOB|nr:hypothetical protein [Roseobacter insulae]MBW4706787.1 hypothetical protein [Roseobacter insulae]